MTGQKVAYIEKMLDVTHLWTYNKVIFRTGIPTNCLNKENKYDRNDNFQLNLAVF